MNLKNVPSHWNNFKFINPNYVIKNSIFEITEKQSKIGLNFITNEILKVYISQTDRTDINYENFSWSFNNIKNNIQVTSWNKKDDVFFFESSFRETNTLLTSYSAIEGVLNQIINGKNPFALNFKSNIKKGWLSIEILFENKDYNCFGLGEQTNPMDKRGKKIIFWNTDNPGYKIGLNPLYQSYPIIIIQDFNLTYAFVFDNPAYSEIDMRKKGRIVYFVKDLQVNMYILFGQTFRAIMEQIKILSGSVLPLPKWALGYQQSRWSYTPSKRVLEIAETFREKKIPCDVIYLDIDYMDNFKCFTFGPDFSDYPRLIEKLHSMGFKVIPIIDPGIKVEKDYFVYEEGISNHYFISNQQRNPVTVKVWPGESHFPDFANTSVQNWWSDLVSNFVKQSKVDGIWCDMNEPSTFDARRTLHPESIQYFEKQPVKHEKIHNVFGLLMAQATFFGLLKSTQNPVVLSRSSYLGGQKYSMAWTGDNVSTWQHLQASIPMILSFGLSGQTIVGPDIGGFNGVPEAKLYERWIVQGAFYPFSRSHTVKSSPDQEPWSFGEEVEAKAKKAIELRYKLLPYYYTLLFEAFSKGYPILRPIFFNEYNESTLDKTYYETEFFLGDYLLFTPFMTKSSKREIYLPSGQWFSWWKKDLIYEGDSYLTIDENENGIIPIFCKNELIIPMHSKNVQYIPQMSLDELSLLLVLKDDSNLLSFNYIEYFDNVNILGMKITIRKEQELLNFHLDELRIGIIPEQYFLPKKLHIQLNYFVRTIKNLSKENYEFQTDKDDWSFITLFVSKYPLTIQIETLF